MSSLIIFGAQYLYLVIVIGAFGYLLTQPRERRWRMALLAVLALPLTYVVAKIMSTLYYDPRPFVVGHFLPLLPHAPDNGFPSDHTLLSAAVAAVVFFFNRTLGALLLVIAFLVGVARVFAGIHHLTDIVGSLVIAASVTMLVWRFVFPKAWQVVSVRCQWITH